MKINTLRLENFQGIKSAAFDFDGQSASIYGDNATGKTTVFNAVTWLLFGGPSTGAKGYTPKTRNQYGGDVHYLAHSAAASFSLEDGRMITLQKVFHENYKKKRGAAAEEFSGHSVDFYINGVPVKEKEYTASLLEFCGGPEQMKILTMPHYFAEDMTWEARRKILLDVCGNVSDADVIAGAAGLEELDKFLLMPGTANRRYTVEEYKKIAATKKTEINKRLQDIPGRIDEAQRAIPEKTYNIAAIEKRLAELKNQLGQLMARKASILAGDASAVDARKRVAEAEAALAEAKSAHLSRIANENQEIQNEINALTPRINEVLEQCEFARAGERLLREAERMEARRKELLEEYAAVQSETWDESNAVCPTCHRPLPEDDIAKMRGDFNERRSARLQEINERGQKEASKRMIEEARVKAAQYDAQAAAAKREYDELIAKRDALSAQRKYMPFEETSECARLSYALAEAENQESEEASAREPVELNRMIQDTDEEIQTLQQQKGQAEQARVQERRIVELEAQEKELSAQYEELEQGIYLCDQFTKAKVRMLTDRINGKFRSVQFRLFVEQVNGGVKDDCEVLVPNDAGTLVPFRDANNAARINAGLEIIEALSEHWGISMPVFVDNAESVTHLRDTTMQTIRLVVSEPDSKLRLVLETAQAQMGMA